MINKETQHWYAIHPDNLKSGEIKTITFWGKKMILWKDSK
jgi:phenylpropionate dioxygenase-like ring-hydroxylating dioxygenase large terminal subunit